MLYRLEKVVQRYEKRTVVNIENLALEKGRLIGLIGPNGAGKTTLLEILAFLQRPAAGGVTFLDRPVVYQNRQLTRLRRKVVLVQQHPILFSTTVYNNIAYPLALRKIPPRRRKARVLELLESADLLPLARARAAKLSGGETQRVAIAMALACDPEVILLDEPTANVDREHQGRIERLILDINRRQGISAVFATHNLAQAARLADRTIFLYNGRVTRAAYENVLQGTIVPQEQTGRCCRLMGGQRLALTPGHPSGPTRIAIAPELVQIVERPQASAEGSTLQGRVLRLQIENGHVRVLVDIGQPLNVLLAEEAFRSIKPGLGDTLYLAVPPEAIEVLMEN